MKAISKLGGDFAAILTLEDHFAAKWHFRRPFRSLKVISQPKVIFAAAKMSVLGFEMALVCQRVVSQLQNSLRNGALVAKIGSFYASQPFRSYKKPCEIRLWLLNWDFLCFAAVSQLGDHFVAKWHFRIGGEFSQPISQLKSDFGTQR